MFTELATWFDGVKAEFVLNFIEKSRWKLLWNGLQNTLIITALALMIGIVLGVLIATVRTTWDKNELTMRKGLGRTALAFGDWLCRLYTTVIRGTPVVIQLMIMYFIIFAASDNGVMIATLAFGLNSGAYVSEIFRGGIMSIDKGQFEAGRSLGLSRWQTMKLIVFPQALKTALPALCNEFIVLIKETSVLAYIALTELTKAGDYIRSKTYSAFTPYIVSGVLYLVVTGVLTKLLGMLERRLRQGDNR